MPVKRILTLLALALLAACAPAQPGTPGGPIAVMTTFSTLNSFVEAVGGSRVSVQNLVPVGVSPETYQPTPQNVEKLAQANILIENGAGIEAWLAHTIQNAGSAKLRIVVCTDGLRVVNNNPHLWMDPQNAKHYVNMIRDALINYDPVHADYYRVNATVYNGKLDALTASIQRRINLIPKSQRVMIVYHNAWQYYNARFGIKTLGFIEPSPGQAPNPKALAMLISLAKQNHVGAIFSEPEYSPKLAQQIARSAGITIVTNLYDDSLGTFPAVSNYISMMNYDTATIVRTMQ